jgi:hypothetical protein
MKLYRHGDASSFLTMTGLSWQAFSLLFDVLFPDNQQPKKAGRPPLMDPTAQLGLYLFHWYYNGYEASLLGFWCYSLCV